MVIRQRHLLALLLSAAAHAGVILTMASDGAMTGGGSPLPPPAGRLTVRVLGPGPSPAPATLPALAAAAPAAPPPRAAPRPPLSSSTLTPLPIPAPAGIRYFQSHELTELPRPDRGMEGTFLVVPGVAARTIKVVLSIDDLGYVAWVDIDEGELSDAEQHLVRQAFFKVQFVPGKIGRIAVRARFEMEVNVDTELRH